jgi:uncharacterized protein (DUF433 family)
MPLIARDDLEGGYLSFLNLVEAHVLASIRRTHAVQLPKVRRALDYVQKTLGVRRPLIEQAFSTDGLDLFIERYERTINASRGGQEAMKEIVGAYLERIERDVTGIPVRLYPFTRQSSSDESLRDDPRVIVMNPAVCYGQPVVRETGIPTIEIYQRYKAGDSIRELARDFRLEESHVEEAIRCEAA